MNFNIVEKIEKNYKKHIMCFFEDEVKLSGKTYKDNKILIDGTLSRNNFTGKDGEKISLNVISEKIIMEQVYIGIGKKEDLSPEIFRKTIFKSLNNENGDILIFLPEYKGINLNSTLAETSYYLNYEFDRYMTIEEERKPEPLTLDILRRGENESIEEGLALGEAVCITRDLINEPANVIYPETLAEITAEYGKKYGFEVEIKDEDEINSLGMEAYMAVARAAEKRPKLIIMRYMGDPNNPKNITGLIGKGVTYDTGGLSLKSGEGMAGMKNDMGGAATIIGSMTAIARMKVKRNIVGVIPACENSIGGNAYRPGDVIGSMGGKTIEILNTDTEGRLTLADAITYSIRKESVTEIIDVATLTGAVITALGFETTGIFTNSNSMYTKIEKASDKYDEPVWRLPLLDRYRRSIKSDIADLANTGGRWGGAVTAAKFLEEFTEGLPWIHLDIAGTAYSDKEDYYYPKGATGKTVRVLYSYFNENR